MYSNITARNRRLRTTNTSGIERPFFQSKLSINPPADHYEQEADTIADKVMSMEAPAVQTDALPISSLQRKCEHCEDENKKTQRKEMNSTATMEDNKLDNYVNGLSSSGQSLPGEVRSFYEPRFGYDFSNVKIHTDTVAAKSAQSINALAYTSGSNIVFNNAQYSPDTDSGKKLLGHELTHVVQQGGGRQAIQKLPLADTGYRFTPPASVKRTIQEIQAVVGINPDGVYGINTKNAVETYQKKLKAAGLYTDTVDGEWGNNTETAHVEFATGTTAENYNCSGLAFKTHTFIGMPATKAILAGMTKLSSCADKCSPYQYKFFFWDYDVSLTDLNTGVTTTPRRDFHIVSGQTDSKGNDPSDVVSKNGSRPVEGPKAPMAWKPISELARVNDHTNAIVPDQFKNRTNHAESCFCSDKLP